VAILLSALSLTTTEAHATAASLKISQNEVSSPSRCNWSVVPSPNGNGNSGLRGVAAVSAHDIWAVGSSSSQRDSAQTLIEHWNGRQWSVVTSPNPGPMYNTLYSVSAVSANDIWAVGVYANDAEVTQTLTMHW